MPRHLKVLSAKTPYQKTCETARYRLILALDFLNWLLKMMESETKARLTLGEFLKQVRETHGLSIEYVADQLKLKISTVRDLEANHYDHVGGVVYIKGYLRSYARLLNLDIEDQLQLNNNADAEAIRVPVSDECAHKQTVKTPYKLLSLLALLIILALLVFTGVHFYTVKNNAHPVKTSSVAATQPLLPLPNALNHPSLNIAQPVEKKPDQLDASNQANKPDVAASDAPPADSEPAVE